MKTPAQTARAEKYDGFHELVQIANGKTDLSTNQPYYAFLDELESMKAKLLDGTIIEDDIDQAIALVKSTISDRTTSMQDKVKIHQFLCGYLYNKPTQDKLITKAVITRKITAIDKQKIHDAVFSITTNNVSATPNE